MHFIFRITTACFAHTNIKNFEYARHYYYQHYAMWQQKTC